MIKCSSRGTHTQEVLLGFPQWLYHLSVLVLQPAWLVISASGIWYTKVIEIILDYFRSS